jgi:hypothetical protein
VAAFLPSLLLIEGTEKSLTCKSHPPQRVAGFKSQMVAHFPISIAAGLIEVRATNLGCPNSSSSRSAVHLYSFALLRQGF